MSNHFSAASLKPPGGDPRLDFTDLYAFTSPEDAAGDARPDIAFSFVFSALDDGAQTATACYATGGQAPPRHSLGNVLVGGAPVGFDDSAEPVRAGACQFFFGVRSDPFFADVEAPSEMFGADPAIGLWGMISLRRNGQLVQMDRGGNPSMNPFINPDDEKDLIQLPATGRRLANYLAPWSKLLRSNGYPPEDAEAAAMLMLPDILRYDRSQP